MDADGEKDEEQAREEDPGSSEAPISGQPGGGLDGDEVPETDDSPAGDPEVDTEGPGSSA